MSVIDELKEFFKDRECHLYQKGDKVKGWACVYFYEIEEFAREASYALEEGGIEVQLLKGHLAVDIEAIIAGYGVSLADLRDIFPEDEHHYLPEVADNG